MTIRNTVAVTTQVGKTYLLKTYPGGSYTPEEFEAYLLSKENEGMIELNLLEGGKATINKLQITDYEQVPVPRRGGATIGTKRFPGRYVDEPKV